MPIKKLVLPEKIEKYLNSMEAARVNVLLCDKYGLEGLDIINFRDLSEKVLGGVIKIADLPANIIKTLGKDEVTAKKMALDLLGSRVLMFADLLGQDVAAAIVSLGGKAEDYKEYQLAYEKSVGEEENYFKQELAPEESYSFTPKEEVLDDAPIEFDYQKEKMDSLEIFENDLAGLFSMEDQEYLRQLNFVLIKLILDEKGFKEELEDSLYKNSEIITTKPFILEEKNEKGTIGNWIKDFIKVNGSDIFSSVALAKYLSESPNPKALDVEERRLVNKTLKLYRNLAFFPESMASVPVEMWEIVPIDKASPEALKELAKQNAATSKVADLPLELRQEMTAVAPTKSKDAWLEATKAIMESKPLDNVASTPVKEEVVIEKKNDSSMEAMLSQYPKGSLEYRAIEQAMKKQSQQ